MAEETARAESLDDIADQLLAMPDEDDDEIESEDAPAPSAEADEPDSPVEDDTPDDAEVDTEADAEDEGQPRGPDGKFLPKPAADAAPANAAPAAASPTAPVVTADTPPPPFSVRAGGREHTLEGIARAADGSLTVSADHAARVTNLLQRGVHYETSFRQELAEMQRKVEAKDAETEKGRLIARELMGLLDQGNEAVAEWLDNFVENRARMELGIQRELLDAERQSFTSGRDAEEQQRQQAEMDAWVESSIPSEVAEVAQQFEGIFEPDDLQRINRRVAAVSNQIFLVAHQDLTAAEMAALGYPEHGPVRKGEQLVDVEKIQRIMTEEASVIKRERAKADEKLRKAKEALEANARNRGGGRPPPAAVTAGGGTDTPKDKPREPTNANEWKDSLMAEIS